MSSFAAAHSHVWSLERTEERRRSATKASTRRRRRGRNGSGVIVVFAFSKGDGSANTIRPDTEWPPNDVSSDFRKAHVGSWTGKSATFDSRGNLIPIHEKFVPDAFKEFGVSVDDFDVKTVTSVDVSSGKGIDAAGLTRRRCWRGCPRRTTRNSKKKKKKTKTMMKTRSWEYRGGGYRRRRRGFLPCSLLQATPTTRTTRRVF
jgi:hypothetical protein